MANTRYTVEILFEALTKGANGALDNLKSSLGGLSSFVSNTLSTAFGISLAGAIQGSINAIRDLSADALNATMDFERMQFALESMVAREIRASGETDNLADALAKAGPKTQELLQWIEDLALKTPFAVADVTGAFQDLMRYGFKVDQAKEMSQALLDVAASSGMTSESVRLAAYAFGQMNAAGKLNMQDLRQLMNAGVDVSSVLREMGYSIADVGKETISSSEFLQKFIEISEHDFGGATDRMSDSISGVVGAIKDFKNIGLRELFKGAFDALLPFAKKFSEWLLGPGRERLKEIGERIGEIAKFIIELGQNIANNGFFSGEVRDMLGQISPKLAEIHDAIKPVIENGLVWIRDNWQAIKAGLMAMAIAFGALTIISTITGLLTALANPLVLIMGLVGLLAAAWEGNWFGIRDTLTDIWDNVLVPTFEAVRTYLEVNIPVWLETLRSAWDAVWGVLAPIVQSVWDIISGYVNAAIAALSGDWFSFGVYMRQVWEGLWNFVISVLGAALKTVKKAIDVFSESTKGDFGKLGNAIRDIWATLMDNLRTAIEGALNVVTEIYTAFISAFEGDWDGMKEHLLAAWKALWDAVDKNLRNYWKIITNVVGELVDDIVDSFKNTNWSDVGKSIVTGIGSGLKSASKWFNDVLSGIIKAAVDAALGFLKGGSGGGGGGHGGNSIGMGPTALGRVPINGVASVSSTTNNSRNVIIQNLAVYASSTESLLERLSAYG